MESLRSDFMDENKGNEGTPALRRSCPVRDNVLSILVAQSLRKGHGAVFDAEHF